MRYMGANLSIPLYIFASLLLYPLHRLQTYGFLVSEARIVHNVGLQVNAPCRRKLVPPCFMTVHSSANLLRPAHNHKDWSACGELALPPCDILLLLCRGTGPSAQNSVAQRCRQCSYAILDALISPFIYLLKTYPGCRGGARWYTRTAHGVYMSRVQFSFYLDAGHPFI